MTYTVAMRTVSRRHVLSALCLAAFLIAAFLLCSFKVLDRDFWWHITAGKAMWDAGRLIAVEPFAYTRAGLPYLATHEWLAQISLYGVWALGGATGAILFRTVMMSITFGLLLLIDPPKFWPNALLAVAAAGAALGGFLERPQLFTFVIVAAMLLLSSRYLSLDDEAKIRRRGPCILLVMLVLQVLWVNLHGGAALLGLVITGALALQRAWDLRGALARPAARREVAILIGAGVGMGLALFASPNGLQTFDYLHRLLTDKTIAFISEWRPREHGYAAFIGPFWVLWIGALAAVRRDWVFCALVAGTTGYLSLTAVRHETLFVFSSLAVTLHQLRHAAWWGEALERLASRPVLALATTLLSAVPVAAFAHAGYRQVVERDHLWGYGVFAPAAGAADFIEREGIRGNLFNTYGIGGYLIHRFYPDPGRKVFIDGRNVDYGYEFMNAAFVAGHSPAEWKIIEDRWDLTYALIDYDAIKQPGWLSYNRVLDADPSWPLVYIDDWTAAYAKDVPASRDVIAAHRFRVLTAEGLEFGWALDRTPKDRLPELERELRRAIEASPASVKARNLLGKLLIRRGRADEVLSIADAIERLQPHRPEASALRAGVAVMRQDWVAANAAFARMLHLAGDDYPDIDYGSLADVAEKAGDWRHARRYRRRAGVAARTLAQTPPSGTTDAPSSAPATASGAIGDLLGGIAEDIETFNDRGIDLASAGKKAEAREAFLRALMLDPGNPLTLSNLCALSLEEGKLAEAIDYGKRGLGRGEDFADLHYNLALAYARTKKYEDARRHAVRAQELGRDASAILLLHDREERRK